MATVSAAIAKSDLSWHEMGPRLWFLASSPSTIEFADVVDPCLALTLLRKNKDVVLLPGSAESREFADFVRELLGFNDSQVRACGKKVFLLITNLCAWHV